MAYTPDPTWVDGAGGATPITAAKLNHMEAGIATAVPKWTASTAYTAGELVLNPSGVIVSANTTFTSGASYNPTNWTTVTLATTDSRLTDTRTPTDGSVTVASFTDATLGLLRDPYALTAGESTLPRLLSGGQLGPASGSLRLTYFTPSKSEAITQVRVPVSVITASGTAPTLIRFGIWQENPTTGDLTLVASTANDTTLLTSTATPSTKALQATWNKVKGQRYAWAPLVVTTGTAPNYAGLNLNAIAVSAESSIGPRAAAQLAGQSDLPSTITAASLGGSGQMLYAALLP